MTRFRALQIPRSARNDKVYKAIAKKRDFSVALWGPLRGFRRSLFP